MGHRPAGPTKSSSACARTTWDQQDCSAGTCSGTVSPGTYSAEGAWGSYRPARDRFIVNGIR